jgi:hypothetical protein
MIKLRIRKVKSHWDRITQAGEERCFVCGRKFRKDQRFIEIGKHRNTGEILRRHEYCSPGSANWIKLFGEGLIFNRIKVRQEGFDYGK